MNKENKKRVKIILNNLFTLTKENKLKWKLKGGGFECNYCGDVISLDIYQNEYGFYINNKHIYSAVILQYFLYLPRKLIKLYGCVAKNNRKKNDLEHEHHISEDIESVTKNILASKLSGI